jgi:nucleoside-diphosphate-sugar epimerase
MNEKRVLITGINGFTGHYVAETFQQAGYSVAGLGSQPGYIGAIPDVVYRQAELTDAAALKDAVEALAPTDVIHLAAVAFVAHGDPTDFYRVNLIGTRNLLAALRSSSLTLNRVILASSANVYGVTRGGALSEDAPTIPANDYAVSKLAMEAMARTFSDLPIVITRPFNYTGRGQSENFLVAKCVAHFRRRAPVIELGNIDVSRDFSDVRTLADAYLALAQRAPVGATVNICSGIPHSLRDIIAMAEEITGHKVEIRVNPAFVRPNEIPSLTGDPTRLNALVPGLQPRPLRETLSWMLEAAAS